MKNALKENFQQPEEQKLYKKLVRSTITTFSCFILKMFYTKVLTKTKIIHPVAIFRLKMISYSSISSLRMFKTKTFTSQQLFLLSSKGDPTKISKVMLTELFNFHRNIWLISHQYHIKFFLSSLLTLLQFLLLLYIYWKSSTNSFNLEVPMKYVYEANSK